MRKFTWMMATLMLCVMSFVACDEPAPAPEPPTPVELTFDIEVVDIAKSEAVFNVTPSNVEADYLVVVLDAKSVEACEIDAEVIQKVYDDIKAYAEANGTTFDAYLADKVKRGNLENHRVENLSPDTGYYVLVFGVDAAAQYATTSELFKQSFNTEGVQQSSCSFELKANVHLTNVAVSVKPSDNEPLWHLVNVSIDEYETYTKVDGEYGWSQEEFYQNYLNTELATLKEQGVSEDEMTLKLFHNGARTLNISGLTPKTKHVVLVAAVEYADGAAYTTSNIKELRYNSGEAADSDLTFDIDVFNVGHYSAEVRITPSDLNAAYYYHIGYIDAAKNSMKPVEIAEQAVYESIYYWENYTELRRHDPVTGVIDFTGENKLELNIAETEYYVVAFSFEPNPTYGTVIDEETGEYDSNPGTITSAPVYVSFTTAEHGDPMTAEFSFKASDVGPYDFYLEIEANDPTIYYQPGIAKAEDFSSQAAIDASSALLKQLMQMCMESQSPCLTIHEALEEKCHAYYRNGDGKYYIANLEPETEYIGYVLTIDTKTGTFARCVYSDVIAKTVTVGGVTPGIELLGVYNGEHEAGEIFGDKELTAGRPIIAVNHTGVENATALFAAISTDKYADVAALSDRYIISNMRGYWQQVNNLAVPYHFFVGEWDVEQTLIAYAQDANGHEGGVCRFGVTPTSAGDIEELRGYVAEMNAAATTTACKSLVINNNASMPSMECVWSEAVGAPREAKVTYHEVEPLAQRASDVMSLGFVKSFAL